MIVGLGLRITELTGSDYLLYFTCAQIFIAERIQPLSYKKFNITLIIN